MSPGSWGGACGVVRRKHDCRRSFGLWRRGVREDHSAVLCKQRWEPAKEAAANVPWRWSQPKSGQQPGGSTSFRVVSGYLNLELDTSGASGRSVWGRVVFWVNDVDAMNRRALAAGFAPEAAPADASWGERYFHIGQPPCGNRCAIRNAGSARSSHPAPPRRTAIITAQSCNSSEVAGVLACDGPRAWFSVQTVDRAPARSPFAPERRTYEMSSRAGAPNPCRGVPDDTSQLVADECRSRR